jgi:type IV secretory pathway VirD2 relaxase
VQRAAREFARAELADHKYVMVLHDHQANPHVHISVRAESRYGKRLNPRKADLHRWRETFAERLRGHGIEAEATRQATRGRSRNYDPLWRLKAREDGRLRTSQPEAKGGEQARATRAEAMDSSQGPGWASRRAWRVRTPQ